jgi:two-component system, OmpR family, response regulator
MTRVLIVEDNEDLQDTYEMLLANEGYDVLTASDGAAGLRAVAEHRPDVVLLDMMMPDVDGLELLQRLPRDCTPPLPPVLATSGFAAYADTAVARGAYAFLGKPLELDVLLAAIRDALAHAPIADDVLEHNHDDVTAARQRADDARRELIADLPPVMMRVVKARLRALARWLPRYYGFGASFIQVLRDGDLCIEAAAGAAPPWVEGQRYPRRGAYCDDVITAGATAIVGDARQHPLPHYALHPQLDAGWRFYAGVPLTTSSGIVIGTLSLLDRAPRQVHAEDLRLLEALGLHVAHALEEIADGVDPDDFIVDEDGLFAAELLPLFAQIGMQRAARTGGAVTAAVLRLESDDDVDLATRAGYEGSTGPGLAIVHRGAGELALVAVGRDDDARRTLAAACDACRRAVAVRADADMGVGLIDLAEMSRM